MRSDGLTYNSKAVPVTVIPMRREVGEEMSDESTSDLMPERRRDSGWREPKFLVTLGALIVTLLSGFWTVARSATATQMAIEKVTSIDEKLSSIDQKLNQMALKDNDQEKDLEYVKKELAEFKAKYDEEKRLQDTYINTARERLIAVEGALGIKNRKEQ